MTARVRVGAELCACAGEVASICIGDSEVRDRRCFVCGLSIGDPERRRRITDSPALVMALIMTASCATIPHLEPATRVFPVREQMTAVVEVDCHARNPADNIDWPDSVMPAMASPWDAHRAGAGVVLSERHVLTAAHLVACPDLPIVHVTVGGRRLRAVVQRDDGAFGDGRDLARLEILSAERFGVHAVPPALGPPGYGWWCASSQRSMSCGRVIVVGGKKSFVADMITGDYDSGVGVYDEYDRLVGVVVARSEKGGETTGTWVATVGDGVWGGVDLTWLRGT